MNIEPLNKELYNRAKALGITSIELGFSGGNDEGYLNVTLLPWDQNKRDDYGKLNADIENWAWDAYSYSGAGDGTEYGDEIVYDLVNKKCSTKEWYLVRETKEFDKVPLEIDNVEAIESDDE